MIKLIYIALGYFASNFVLKLFTAIGVTFFTYKAMDAVITPMLDRIQTSLSGAPSDALALLSMSGFPESMSIIASAVLTATAINSYKAYLGVRK